MWEFVEFAAEELYRRARLDPRDACGAAEVAAGILGRECIRFVPGTALPGRAELARVGGKWMIFLREKISAEGMHHAIGHELGHFWARNNMPDSPQEEEIADRIGAALCAPRGPYMEAHQQHGWNTRALGRIFVIDRSAAALRLAECTGRPTALVSPRSVRVRGDNWPWPEEWQTRAVASSSSLAPGLTRSRLGARVLLQLGA